LILGAGFAGLALSRCLLATGHQVFLLSRSAQYFQHTSLINLVGSYADTTLLRDAISRCDTIIHAASDTTPGVSAKTPVEEVFGNFQPTLELIQVLQDYPDKHVIYLSSGGAIYGNLPKIPADESQPCKPISYYGAGKLAVESFFKVVNHQYGSPITILRPSNFYGPGQETKEGFGLIFHLLHRAKKGQSIDIWGDGEITRDFLFIDDFVKACLKIIAARKNEHNIKIYNIGSGEGHSINSVVRTVEEVSGIQLQKKYLSARPVDVKKIVLDCRLIKEEHGWQPTTTLTEGIAATWEWMNS
jgi:UDP-glucose 4-epimerase